MFITLNRLIFVRLMKGFLSVLLLTGYSTLDGFHYEQDSSCKKVLEQPGKDSVFMNPVYFCTEGSGNYFYYSPINTTVCNDTLCQLVLVKVYWDLAGNYTSVMSTMIFRV